MAFLYSLASSSKGNCVYVGDRSKGILIDAGVTLRGFHKHLSMIDVAPSSVLGIFVTHEHIDHVKGLARIQASLRVPIYTTKGTAYALLEKGILTEESMLCPIGSDGISLSDMEITCFATPHDCAQSSGFQIGLSGHKRIGYCTDLGYVTPEIHQQLKECDLVFLESNYDESMLLAGPYPYPVKRRIMGQGGHLSNKDCAEEILRLCREGVSRFVLGHLSEQNNRPELAYDNVVHNLKQHDLTIQKDYRLFVAPTTNYGAVIPL